MEVRSEQAELGELGDERHRERAILADVLLDPRQELLRDERANRLSRELLLVGEKVVEAEEIDAGEFCHGSGESLAKHDGPEALAPGPSGIRGRRDL